MARRKIDPETKAEAVALAGVVGEAASAEALGVTRQAVNLWGKEPTPLRPAVADPRIVAEKKQAIDERITKAIDLVMERILSGVPIQDATLSQLTTAFGTLVDKQLLLRGQPTSISESRPGLSDEERARRVRELVSKASQRKPE